MPIYEYHCEACGSDFEALVAFAHADEVACENCGSPQVTRLASSFCSSDSSAPGGGGKPPCATSGGG